LPEIDWQTGSARGRTRELLDAVEDRAMEQLVTFSTHTGGEYPRLGADRHARADPHCK
jgi:hypothetical protein